jgi:4-alpha-glucanotransferase
MEKMVNELPADKETRGAGILLHITSLPSAFGIGDLGPEAKRFAKFLHRSHQQYWQLLPLNPVEAAQSYSPYSSISSMAGNTLLISPELLIEDGFLKAEDVESHKLPVKRHVNFKKAARLREVLFDKAFKNFLGSRSYQVDRFEKFCEAEKNWLHDFAMYTLIKNLTSTPWYKWAEPYKKRNAETLAKLEDDYREDLCKIKWLQYIFDRQWKSLKKYCNALNIRMFGDLPFYVSYDSADVWAHTEIFSVNNNGEMIGSAGVPPDYFNANGQLWGMPVFNWDVLQARKYDWWINRLEKNLQQFDLLRLDHFRAFAAYWEVPAQDETAINGQWKNGPGENFFQLLKEKFNELPFIAEDLGDIDDKVYNLRDKFSLPGMKVLQFAFGDNTPQSDYIPHNFTNNFIVYTGTHDNNTTAGWFRKDATKTALKHLKQYAGKNITQNNIHTKFSKLAYASVAKTAIIPMQDILGLGEDARINTPASVDKNWLWRLSRNDVTPGIEKKLRKYMWLYNR